MSAGQASAGGRVLTRDFILVCLSTLFVFISHFFFFPVLPKFVTALGGRESEIGVLFAVSNAASLVIRPFVGRLVDGVGSRKVAIAGALLDLVTALSYQFAQSFGELLISRVLSGVALAFFATATGTYAALIAPPEHRGRAMGYFGMASNVSFAFGPLVAVGILTAGSLRSLNERATNLVDGLTGSATMAENFTLVFFAGGVAAAIAVLTTVGMREHRPEGDGRKRSLWSPAEWFTPAALMPASVNFVQIWGMAAIITSIPLLTEERGMDGAERYFYFFYAGTVILSRVLLGGLSDRLGRAASIVPGLGAAALGLLMIAVADSVVVLYVAAAIYGLGSGSVQPALQALTIDIVRPDEQGRAMGTYTLASDTGMATGAIVMAALLQETDFGVMYSFAGCVVIGGIVLYLLPVRRFVRRRAALADAHLTA
jgi:MFS family permease